MTTEQRTAPGHILVVEDEAYIRRGLTLMLTLEDYRVTCAADGEESWDVLTRHAFDLVITDLKMPRLDGLQLLHRIRGKMCRLPVILITGHGEAEATASSLHDEHCQILAKPFSREEVLAAVARALAPPGTAASS